MLLVSFGFAPFWVPHYRRIFKDMLFSWEREKKLCLNHVRAFKSSALKQYISLYSDSLNRARHMVKSPVNRVGKISSHRERQQLIGNNTKFYSKGIFHLIISQLLRFELDWHACYEACSLNTSLTPNLSVNPKFPANMLS